jgi:hypothetical protein
MSYGCIYLKQNFECLVPHLTVEEDCMMQQGTLKVMHVMFFTNQRLVLDRPVLPCCTPTNGAYYYASLHNLVCVINNQKCYNTVSFSWSTMLCPITTILHNACWMSGPTHIWLLYACMGNFWDTSLNLQMLPVSLSHLEHKLSQCWRWLLHWQDNVSTPVKTMSRGRCKYVVTFLLICPICVSI